MTACNGMEEQVFEYIDGLLSIESRNRVDRHLESCTKCKHIFDDAKQLKEQLRNLTGLSTSQDFDMVLRTRIKMEKRLNTGLFTRPVRVPMYAAAVAIIIIAVFAGFNLNRGVAPNQQQNPYATSLPAPGSLQGFGGGQQPGSQEENVVFPMDVMPVGGTPLRSQSPLKTFAGPDSIRNGREPNRIQTVEF